MKTFFITLSIALLFQTSAFAVPVWNYSVQPAGPIKGGKLKIIHMGRSEGVRQIRFKYKLQTIVGYKEDWIPYNLPEQAFDAKFLGKMQIGQSVVLHDFTLSRTGNKNFSMKGSDGKFDYITTPTQGTPWSRITLKVKNIVLSGPLLEVTDE